MISFASSIMKYVAAPSSRFIFPVKKIRCIAFGSATSACCLFKLTEIN